MGSPVICPDCFDGIRNEVRFSVPDAPLPGTSRKIHDEIRLLPGKERLPGKIERKRPIQVTPFKRRRGTVPCLLLVSDFHGAVDDYLALCEAEGISPEIAYKGSLNVRFKNSDIHRRAAIYAIMHEQSLNSFIEEAVKEKLALVHA